MPIKINLHTDPKKRIELNRARLQEKAAAKQAGTYKEPASKGIAWRNATKAAEVRAGMTHDVLSGEEIKKDASLQQRMAEGSRIGRGGRAAGAGLPPSKSDLATLKRPIKPQSDAGRGNAAGTRFLNEAKSNMPHDKGFIDLGAKPPRDAGDIQGRAGQQGRADRARSITRSLREGRSSVKQPKVLKAKAAPAPKAPAKPAVVHRTGPPLDKQTGVIKSDVARPQVDLGRKVANIVRAGAGNPEHHGSILKNVLQKGFMNPELKDLAAKAGRVGKGVGRLGGKALGIVGSFGMYQDSKDMINRARKRYKKEKLGVEEIEA